MSSEKDARWDEFLGKYPLEKVRNMTLEEYTSNTNDSFIYHLEFGIVKDLGSIKGHLAEKFGIYRRGTATTVSKLNHDEHYAWKTMLGNDREKAFEKVRNTVCAIIENAQKGQFENIDSANNGILSPMVTWKITFLYQDRDNPKVVSVFSEQALNTFLKEKLKINPIKLSRSEKYLKIIAYNKDNTDIIHFSKLVWDAYNLEREYKAWLHDKLTKDSISSYCGIKNIIKKSKIKTSMDNIFKCNTPHEFDIIYESLLNSDFPITGTNWVSYLSKYREFLVWWNEEKEAMQEDKSTSKPFVTEEDFLQDVYLSPTQINKIKNVLSRKKNIVLQGSPGVGKTFMAKRLAYSLIGRKNDERLEMIQFHQSYGYENFVMGYRPNENSFELKNGSFYGFCEKARYDKNNHYYFLIDEINRGNLSKIFGELLMLIEDDKRDEYSTHLIYRNESFTVPSNVYIIGMMNTADRSLAIMDYALRRRFAFIDIEPAFENSKFKEYQESVGSKKLDDIIKEIMALNKHISDDPALGKGFQIGHSYFCNLQNSKHIDFTLASILEYEILPLLEEYWFDDAIALKEHTEKLKSFLKNSGNHE